VSRKKSDGAKIWAAPSAHAFKGAENSAAWIGSCGGQDETVWGEQAIRIDRFDWTALSEASLVVRAIVGRARAFVKIILLKMWEKGVRLRGPRSGGLLFAGAALAEGYDESGTAARPVSGRDGPVEEEAMKKIVIRQCPV